MFRMDTQNTYIVTRRTRVQHDTPVNKKQLSTFSCEHHRKHTTKYAHREVAWAGHVLFMLRLAYENCA